MAFFVVTTFVLHKIEAYYLNPAWRPDVNLPSLILVISLILHEHVFGLVGLFLSFPVLYIGLNILHELRAALGADPAADDGPIVCRLASRARLWSARRLASGQRDTA